VVHVGNNGDVSNGFQCLSGKQVYHHSTMGCESARFCERVARPRGCRLS
jgi:hypothetical protein